MKFSSLVLAAALPAAPLPLAAQHRPGAAHGHQAAGENHAHSSPHGSIVRSLVHAEPARLAPGRP